MDHRCCRLCPAQTSPALPVQGPAPLTPPGLFGAQTGREMKELEGPGSARRSPAGPCEGPQAEQSKALQAG